MKFLSLFAGIGGFDLGLERAGMICVGQVEINTFCQAVLKKHWPNVKRMSDIREVNGNEFGTVDLVCGGFPCQPFSCAGKRRGKEDDRYLWPEMVRVIETVRPSWVIGENVAGIVSMALDKVHSDLESIGYTVQSFIIPACAVGAPHRRDRVWIIGNTKSSTIESEREICGRKNADRAGSVGDDTNSNNIRSRSTQNGQSHNSRDDRDSTRKIKVCKSARPSDEGKVFPDTIDTRLQGYEQSRTFKQGEGPSRPVAKFYKNASNPINEGCIRRSGGSDTDSNGIQESEQTGSKSRSATARCNEDVANTKSQQAQSAEPGRFYTESGFPNWGAEWPEVATSLCGVDDGIPRRVDRLKALGNAVVPQVVEEIGKHILHIEQERLEI